MKAKTIRPYLRYLLSAVLFLVAGDVFFQFGFLARSEPPMEAQEFLISLAASGYFFKAVGVVVLNCAIMLLIRRTVGLALAMFAPIAVNLLLYHWFLDPGFSSSFRDVALVLLYVVNCVFYRQSFRSLFEKV